MASMSNQQISDGEIVRHQLKEAADIERSNVWSRHARRAVGIGVLVGGIGMLITFNFWLIPCGAAIGGLCAWFAAWRHFGQLFVCFAFTIAMALPIMLVGFSPFTVLAVVCVGMLIGIAIDSAHGL